MSESIAYICLNDCGNLIIGRLIENGYNVDIIKSKADIKLINEKEQVKAVIVHITSANAPEIDMARSINLALGLDGVKYIVITEFKYRDIIKEAIDLGASDIITDLSDYEQIIRKIGDIAGVVNQTEANELYVETDFIMMSFNEVIIRELNAAARGSYELSIVTLYPETDMGQYREISDDFLNTLKVVFAQKLRSTDYVLIHDKKVVVVLPFTDDEGCNIVIEKLKETYSSHPALKPVNTYTRINYSFAIFPRDGRTVEKLIGKASPSQAC